MFTKRLMDKEDVRSHTHTHTHTHTQNRILFSHKKDEILPFATTWMDLKSIILSVVSQTEKDKYCMFSLTCEIGRASCRERV